MKRIFQFQTVLIFGFWLAFSYAEEKPELTAEAQKIVDYLLDDWKTQMHSTSIPMAMKNLLYQNPRDELRLQIAEYFREHLDLASNLRWWGVNNYILSNDEKVIAKYLLNTKRDEERLPRLQEAITAVGLTAEKLKARLAFLAGAGLLKQSTVQELGYTLAEGYQKWGGPMRYNFHTVNVEGEDSFDVW